MNEAYSDEDLSAAAGELVACASSFAARGWCQATSGNFSATLSREPLRLLISPSGADKGRLAPADLLVVGPEGVAFRAGGRPSAETALHLVLAGEARAGAVLHTHSVWGTLLGERFAAAREIRIAGYEMLKGLRGVRDPARPVLVPVIENSQDMARLADRLREALATHPASCGLLIAGHGLYAWGEDPGEARRHVECFEFLFELVGRRTRLDPGARDAL